MQEKISILSAEQYFKKYAVDGIGKGADRWMIKRQLVDAFRKEIFSLVALRTKKQFYEVPPEGDPEASRIVKNIIHDAVMKWKKLCGMFAQYKETANLIGPNDLKLYDEIGEIGTTTEDLMAKQEEEDDVGNAEEVGETETGEEPDSDLPGEDRRPDGTAEPDTQGSSEKP